MTIKTSLFLLLLFYCSISFSQLSLTNGITSYLINFDASQSGVNQGSYTGSGLSTSPNSGQLDGDAWAISGMSSGTQNFGQTNTTNDFARGQSNGGVGSGGLYSFNVGSNNKAIGIQPTGSDWTPGHMTLKITNNQSASIQDLTISYNVYIRNDQNRSNSFSFSYSTNNSNYTAVSNATVTSNSSADGSPSWVLTPVSISLSSLGLNPNQSLYIKWNVADVSGSGSRDEIALDDISIRFSSGGNNCVEPSQQANNLSFSNVTTSSISGSFNSTGADQYLVIQTTNPSFTGSITDGTNYTDGSSVGNGVVIQNSSSTSFTSMGLSTSTTYYYFIYALNNDCTGGPDYLSLNPLTGNSTTSSDPNNSYYSVVNGQTCEDLKTVLHNLIDNHTQFSYGALWSIYQDTDDRINDSGNSTIVWDMYSDNPTGGENEFTFGSEQCGSFSTEGDCYNREHSFPKSWWGGSTSVPQYTDIFVVVPSDGWVNALRNNFPYGEVQAGGSTQTTANGSKMGSSSITIPGYTGNVFEPIDAYKGDLARGYFYLLTRYEDVIAGWENNTTESDAVLDGTSFPGLEQWALDMLIDWHNSDPVSQKEIDRNNEVFDYQQNRNPFIDHPEYVSLIWETCSGGGSDNQSPTSPTNLSASNVQENSVDLNWIASNDNIGVAGYKIYQNGSNISSTSGTSISITGLTAATTYLFNVTAYDAAGNESAMSNTISITTDSGSSGPVVLHEGYFESGWDNWQDGGSDASRYSGFRSSEGNYSIRLRDNSGTGSSMTSEEFDLSSFSTVEIAFSYYVYSFENVENFFLKYHDGNSWITVENYIRGTDFNNYTYSTASLVLDNSTYNFPVDAQFRFQADASSNADHVYIDAVVITGDPSNTNMIVDGTKVEITQVEDVLKEKNNETVKVSSKAILLYPNPANTIVQVDLDESYERINKIQIYNSTGQLVRSIQDIHTENIAIDISNLENGIYIMRFLTNENDIESKVFIKN